MMELVLLKQLHLLVTVSDTSPRRNPSQTNNSSLLLLISDKPRFGRKYKFDLF